MPDPNEEGPPSTGALTQTPTANNAKPSVGKNSAGADISAAIPARVTIEDVHKQCKLLYTEKEQADAWTDVAKKVETHSDKMVERWIKEIDTNLVFAGLFSAILTAFNVPAYALLSPPDPSISLLQQISNKLDSFSINHPFINSTQPSSANMDIASPIPRWAVWLNGLWFSGLILSLTSASMGLLSKQWLNEYSSGVTETSRYAARVRQYRLENLKAWHVEEVVNTIPVLLQISLACFLAGLLVFLWNLHNTVAAIASTLVGLLAIFTVVVTLLPLWKPRCAYLSPQIRTLYHIWQPKRFIYWVCDAVATFCCGTTGVLQPGSTAGDPQSTVGDPKNTAGDPQGPPGDPQSAVGDESPYPSLISRLHAYFKNWKPKKTWQGEERSRIDDLKGELDVHTLGEAYRITLHPHTLSKVTQCLMGFDANVAIGCFRLLHKYAQEHFGPTTDGIWGQQQMLWLRVTLCVSLTHGEFLTHKASPTSHNPPAEHDQFTLDTDEEEALRAYFNSGSWSSGMQAVDGEWAASALDALTDYLVGEGTGTLSQEAIDTLGRLRTARKNLIGSAIDREEPLMTVVQRVISGTYRQVLLVQERLTGPYSSKTRAAQDTRYLQSVWHEFLEYASRALTLYIPANDLETARAYIGTPDVLAKLTHALLELFTQGPVQSPIELTHLDDVMRKLRDLDDTRVEECIPDELVPKLLDLAEKLATSEDSDEDRWASLDIQLCARSLHENINRVKCKPAATWAYDRIHLQQKPGASADEVKAAHTSYLKSVDYFLDCANDASKSSRLSANDLETICTNTRGVLTELTRTLLQLFATGDRVRTTIESTYLDDVMRTLRNLGETRVEEWIPDDLVPEILDLAEKLATAKDYDEDLWVDNIQNSACVLTANIARVKCTPATTWAYHRVRLQQKPGASSDEARAAYTSYLKSVDYFYFLERDNHASTSSKLSASDPDTVRAYTQEVFTELARTLTELFAKDQVRTTVESTYLDDVMRKLCDLDDTCLEECVPDELVPRILDLTETLATAADYYDNRWVSEIQDSARKLKANIVRVKCKPAATWAYHRVRLQRKPGASLDAMMIAHTSYLKNVDYFLGCVDRVSETSSGSLDTGPESLRDHTRDVLTKLTHALLELFAKDRVRTTIESTYLDDVMRKLRDLDDARVGECIPDELVPEILDLAQKLIATRDYDEDRWVNGIQDSARALKANIARVKCNFAVTWAYRQVRLQQKPGVSSDEARAAHTSYLQNADYFLECVNCVTTSLDPPANDLETVRANTQEVLTELTRTLLELFAEDRMQTTIASMYLVHVMQKLCDVDDIRVGEWVPDELVPEILNLAEKFATTDHYADNEWVNVLQRCARSLHENVDRVKYGKPAVTWAYHRLRLQRAAKASSDDTKAAHASYLQSVEYLLQCANRDSTLSGFPTNALETVRANTQEVLTELTRTLLELFAKDQVRTTIESTYLDDVMRTLRDVDDSHVKEWVPDELAPKILDLAEKLATADCYVDDEWVNNIQRCACSLHENIDRVKYGKPAATWAYHRIRHQREPGASLDETKAAHTTYLQSVDYFLQCANRDSTISNPSTNYLETVRADTQEVLTELTRTLLQSFAKDLVRTTIESTYLDDVMRDLRNLDDARVKEWIPDDLIPEILELTEKLATADHYVDDEWVDSIQHCASALKANIARVKCKPGSTTSRETTPAPLTPTKPAIPTGGTVGSSDPNVKVDTPSDVARDRGGDSQDHSEDFA